jgi:hypothetical protein
MRVEGHQTGEILACQLHRAAFVAVTVGNNHAARKPVVKDGFADYDGNGR